MSFTFPTSQGGAGTLGRRNIDALTISARTGNATSLTLASDTAISISALEIVEKSSETPPDAGFGRIWVRGDDPNVPVFTKSDGTDIIIGQLSSTAIKFVENDALVDPPAAGYGQIFFNSDKVFVVRDENGGELQIDTSQAGAVCIGMANVTGPGSTVVGHDNNTGTGSFNIIIGHNSGDATMTANDNIIIGNYAGTTIGPTGASNICMGYQAQVANNSSDGISIGHATNSYTSGIAIGGTASAQTYGIALGYSTTAGEYSIACGYNANCPSDYSIAIGSQASAVGATKSTVLGKSASAAAAQCVVVGFSAASTGAKSCVIGNLSSTNQPYATVVGYKTMSSGAHATIVNSSGLSITAAEKTTVLGRGYFGGSTGSTRIGGQWGWIGSANTLPGTMSVVMGNHSTGGPNSVTMGYGIGNNSHTNSIAFGTSTTATATNRIDFFSISTLNSQVALTVTSDGRFKKNIENVADNTLALIDDLQPVFYRLSEQGMTEFGQTGSAILTNIQNDPDPERRAEMLAANTEMQESQWDWTKLQVGMVAQAVRDVFVAHGVDDSLVVHTPEHEAVDLYGIKYEALIPFLVKAVQELTFKYQDLRAAAEAL